MRTLLLGTFGLMIGFSSTLLGVSCVSADYTDREVNRAVETLVSRKNWVDRKPMLEKLQDVLPKAITRFEGNDRAKKILSQIELAVGSKLSICRSEISEQGFSEFNLTTNTSIRSLELDEVLSGGPSKDGIPALTNPKFLSISNAKDQGYLQSASEGIVVEYGTIAKFYPYNILNRHEIVNDTVGDSHVAITFCPLCGTAIVFDREFDGDVVEFGVSGLLYNSNLLMYDNRSESLWSQAAGKAVAGFYTDKQLEYVDSDVQTFEDFEALYPDGVVLSNDTGHSRKYGANSPYGDYNSNDDLYFPVANSDSSLPKKTLLYVVNDTEFERSVAFIRNPLKAEGKATLDADGVSYTAEYNDGIVEVKRNGIALTAFTQMRFSWTAHESNPRYLWGIDSNEE